MRLFFTILSFFLFFSFSYAQNIDKLQEEIDYAEREIERINSLLQSNRQEQIKSDERVKLLERRLNVRQNLVKQTNIKISSLETKLQSCDAKVILCESRIDSIKQSFSSLVLSANCKSYVSLDYNDKIYLSSLESSYISLISELDSVILLTGITRKEITAQKKELESLQIKRQKEVNKIITETSQLAKIKEELKIGESSMLSQIEQQRAKINELQRAIEHLISLENQNNLSYDARLSSSFLGNKGKFPSPLAVESSIIDHYGVHDHPTIKGVKVSNKGVNLAFTGPSDVRTIFDGEVRGVYAIAGMANTVLVRHGRYISVYANLSSVSVSKGDKVSTGQSIGSISSPNMSELFLHFELWKESSTMDPSLWINFNKF